MRPHPDPQQIDSVIPDPAVRCDHCGAYDTNEIAGRNLCDACCTSASACCSGDESAD